MPCSAEWDLEETYSRWRLYLDIRSYSIRLHPLGPWDGPSQILSRLASNGSACALGFRTWPLPPVKHCGPTTGVGACLLPLGPAHQAMS
ncbi:hypothetical protein DM860_001081 [Cuscuta australis]|uniref:Uncharacterized protein n=1 Tax=Cuscuta australis TaxID=267555 RepID=A0A328DX57_9ASTE|nr:hypothetical protein DM860_001081 [Cuscuta australis]